MEDDNLIHIPAKDYIDKKTWWTWIITLLLVPSIVGIFTAGKLFVRLEAAEVKAGQAATKAEVTSLGNNLIEKLNDIKTQQKDNTKEILELIKEKNKG